MSGLSQTHSSAAADGDLMEALACACALVAQADGWIEIAERRRLLERSLALNAASPADLSRVTQRFDVVTRLLDEDPASGEAAAAQAMARIAGRPDAARGVIQAAGLIAAADGGHDFEEREVLLRLCRMLDQPPEAFGLTPARGRRS